MATFYPETSEDQWVQAALTVEGKIGNFDMVYAGSYLNRDVDTESDYSDYSYWYDTPTIGYGALLLRRRRRPHRPVAVHPGQGPLQRSTATNCASPRPDNRFRFVAGLFCQRQEHDIEQRYLIDDLGSQHRA